MKRAHVAQLVERTLGKGEVGGSNPLLSSIAISMSKFANLKYLVDSSLGC